MKFYGIEYFHLLKLPIYTFWEMARNIDRIRAEEDQRLLNIMCAAFGGNPENLFNRFDEERGEVVVKAGLPEGEQLDRQGLERLKAMMAGFAAR